MYKYYITNSFNGSIEGTNSKEVAYEASMSCDYFVLEVETGKWISMNEDITVREFTWMNDELES